MTSIQTQRVQLPSCSLAQRDFEKIGQIVERLTEKTHYSPNFSVNGKGINYKFDNLHDFITADWPSNIETIKMSASGPDDKSAQVEFDFRTSFFWASENIIKVSGQDGTWIKGTIKTVEEQLEHYRSNRRFAYTYWPLRVIPEIIVLYLFLNALGVYLIFPIVGGLQTSVNIPGLFLLLSVPLVFFFDSLVTWLFPYMEMKPTKGLRSFIRKALAFLITLLIGEFIIRSIF